MREKFEELKLALRGLYGMWVQAMAYTLLLMVVAAFVIAALYMVTEANHGVQ